jgi:hypothetical protein
MSLVTQGGVAHVAPGVVWQRIQHRIELDALQVRNRYRRVLVEQIRYQALSSRRPELFARLLQILMGQAIRPLSA